MTSDMKPKVFVSHIAEEAGLAGLFRDRIARDFLGMVEVFVSSDSRSISVGDKWLNEIDSALKNAKAELLLCSRRSVARPWINFEAGAGWVRGIPIVPICHTGMRPVDLPVPLNMLQGITANVAEDLNRLYQLLARELGSQVPDVDFRDFANAVRLFEDEYGTICHVREAVAGISEQLPSLAAIFVPAPVHRKASGDIPEHTLNQIRKHLDRLQQMKMIVYSLGGNKLVFGTGGVGGNVVELNIEVTDGFYAIADRVKKDAA
jgi:hypothetical protein